MNKFMSTKLFELIFTIFCFVAFGYFVYHLGALSGYMKGYKEGRQVNKNAEVVIISQYVYPENRIVRFDPRYPNVAVILDMEKGTIGRLFLDEERMSVIEKELSNIPDDTDNTITDSNKTR